MIVQHTFRNHADCVKSRRFKEQVGIRSRLNRKSHQHQRAIALKTRRGDYHDGAKDPPNKVRLTAYLPDL
jgi:hypothetical protein